MSLPLISLSSISIFRSNIIALSELLSPSPTPLTTCNHSLFNRKCIRSHFSSSLCFHPNSVSHFSSMPIGTDLSNGDEFAGNRFDSDGSRESTSDNDEASHLHELCRESSPTIPERWHVLGLGQAMVIPLYPEKQTPVVIPHSTEGRRRICFNDTVDFSGVVDYDFLHRLELDKGTRKVVNHEERGRILQAMDGRSYMAAAGGSLSNSLVALARLGGQSIRGPVLNVAMIGSVGSDPLGGFYRSKLRRANVNFLSAPVKDGTTGTVIVLTTPDAQRTMLAYQGTSSRVNYDPSLASLISKTSILIIEGYLFEFPDTIKTITKACEEARRCGALVAITASDVTCIEKHYDDFWNIMANYADIIFANSNEARTFCDFSSKESPVSATRYLSHFVPYVSVTDGPRGSYIGVKGETVYIPPSPCVPVDTCGAGDAYASGILYGILHGIYDLRDMGTLAAKVASVVVSQQGTRLKVHDAVKLAESFAFHHESTTIFSDVGSDQISTL